MNCLNTISTIVSQGNNVSDGGDCPLNAAGDLAGANPMLSPFGDHGGPTQTFDLLPGSPAIDRGRACPAVDQRDVPRDTAVCDSGAVEHVPAVAPRSPRSSKATATKGACKKRSRAAAESKKGKCKKRRPGKIRSRAR